jgi:hypothetical protein
LFWTSRKKETVLAHRIFLVRHGVNRDAHTLCQCWLHPSSSRPVTPSLLEPLLGLCRWVDQHWQDIY